MQTEARKVRPIQAAVRGSAASATTTARRPARGSGSGSDPASTGRSRDHCPRGTLRPPAPSCEACSVLGALGILGTLGRSTPPL
ncbi:hypothetical protein SPI_01473 [Niveomyces insectorum RCEF 264]|uniref:Uncharacterized protein n=1 Tax=Niveomyces insectorum RCEF 264 TaxID=1081102 RepID=A0A167YZU5_9HYPO|nr:hypothetical protein SPI_01473 [Niveomyces insectorum RCEF 264]